MLKRELIPIVLSFQNKMTEDNNTMLHKIRKFSDNFAKLHAELVVKMGKCPVLKKSMFRGGWSTLAS